MEYTAGLWAAYIMALECHYPKMSNEKAWVVAMEGLYIESIGKAADWDALAAQAETTVRTLTLRKNKLLDAAAALDDNNKGGI